MTYTTCSSQAEQVEVRLVPDKEVQEPASSIYMHIYI